MAKNPDPLRITNEMWMLWEEAERVIPGVRLGGIYADKKGYHNTVYANKANWPGNYSIELVLDTEYGNLNRARGIDLTMSTEEMIKWTRRMKNSALDPADFRLDCMREFYGTLDGKTVYGLIKDSVTGEWRRSTADSTHLWHGHGSIFARFVNNWIMLSGLVSVWAGESLVEWEGNSMFPKQGESGEEVRYWQSIYNAVRDTSPVIVVDGDYGKATTDALAHWARSHGGSDVYPGNAITSWLAVKLQTAYIMKLIPDVSAPLPFPEDQVKTVVSDWLDNKFASGAFKLSGEVDGRVEMV